MTLKKNSITPWQIYFDVDVDDYSQIGNSKSFKESDVATMLVRYDVVDVEEKMMLWNGY